MSAARPTGPRPVAWWRTLLVGVTLWIAAVALFAVTENVIVLPSVILVGSFLVPVVAAEWWWGREPEETAIPPILLLRAFLVAGLGGLLVAAGLESWLLPGKSVEAVWIAVIEETVKLVLVVVFARRLVRRRVIDGLVLGAAVGFGFAAFESAGYALSVSIEDGSFDFRALVENELLRGVEAPFLHGAWTAAAGAALFARRRGRLALTFAFVVALHAIWDASSAAALAIAVLVSGDEGQRSALDSGVLPDPRAVTTWLYGTVQNAVQLTAAVAGVLLLRRWYRHTASDARGGASTE